MIVRIVGWNIDPETDAKSVVDIMEFKTKSDDEFSALDRRNFSNAISHMLLSSRVDQIVIQQPRPEQERPNGKCQLRWHPTDRNKPFVFGDFVNDDPVELLQKVANLTNEKGVFDYLAVDCFLIVNGQYVKQWTLSID